VSEGGAIVRRRVGTRLWAALGVLWLTMIAVGITGARAVLMSGQGITATATIRAVRSTANRVTHGVRHRRP
jgi:hypothetical protein